MNNSFSNKSARDFTLDKAKELINGDRKSVYGDAATEFGKVADAWNAIFGWNVRVEQVPQAMAVLKMIRLQNSPDHIDSWIDIAGYTALGAETALRETIKVAPRPPEPQFRPDVLDC